MCLGQRARLTVGGIFLMTDVELAGLLPSIWGSIMAAQPGIKRMADARLGGRSRSMTKVGPAKQCI